LNIINLKIFVIINLENDQGENIMQISINFKNENVAQKVLWFLRHLKDEGVEILDTNKKSIKDDNEIEFKNLQLDSMSKTWDNDEDKAWDEL
jgi:hypothetical protein